MIQATSHLPPAYKSPGHLLMGISQLSHKAVGTFVDGKGHSDPSIELQGRIPGHAIF